MTQQSNQPNFYEFTGDAHIIYLPNNANGEPQLDYQDDEFTHTFAGNEIRVQQDGLGTMLTVTLKIAVDVGGTKATLLLPYVNLTGGTTEESFTTLAIKTESTGNLVRPGPTLSYKVLHLQGSAQLVNV